MLPIICKWSFPPAGTSLTRSFRNSLELPGLPTKSRNQQRILDPNQVNNLEVRRLLLSIKQTCQACSPKQQSISRGDPTRLGCYVKRKNDTMKKLVRIHASSGTHWVGNGFPVRSVFDYN